MILSISKPNHTSIQPDDNKCFFITKTHFHNQKVYIGPPLHSQTMILIFEIGQNDPFFVCHDFFCIFVSQLNCSTASKKV